MAGPARPDDALRDGQRHGVRPRPGAGGVSRPGKPSRRRCTEAQTDVIQSGFATAPPRFVDDPHFDLEFHTPVIAVPGKGTIDDILPIAEQVRTRDYDRQRPLWEFVLITGMAGGGSALLLKIHYSLTDAVGGLGMIIAPLFGVERDERVPQFADLPQPRSISTAALALDAFGTRVAMPSLR